MVRIRQLLLHAVVPGLVAGLVGLTLLVSPLGGAIEQRFGLAWLFALRGAVAPPQDVVLISIDKASSQQLGLPYDTSRWPRSLHARLVDGLAAAGARSITFDLHFKEARPAEDAAFADALHRAGNVVLLEFLEKDQPAAVNSNERMLPLIVQQRSPATPEIAAAAAGQGPFTLPKVPDQVASFWTFDENAGGAAALPLVSLAVFFQPDYAAWRQAANAGEGASLIELLAEMPPAQLATWLQDLRVGHVRSLGSETSVSSLFDSLGSALQPPTSRFLNFYGPAQTIPTIFYADALRLLEASQGNERFAGKAVFVGVSSPVQWQLRDAFRTVYSDPETGLDLSGSEILATAFANLKGQTSLQQPGLAATLGMLLGTGLLLGLAAGLLRPLWALVAVGAGVAAFLMVALHFFATQQLWLPLVVPVAIMAPLTLFAMLLWQHRRAHSDLQRIQQVFGHYLPQSTMRRLAAEGYHSVQDRQTLFGVCLMTDAEGYTQVAENMPSDRLVDLVNDYLGVIIQQVRANGGEVSDIKGDSIMAFWAGRENENALRASACRCMLAIDNAMGDWNRHNPYGISLPTRVGMHCGGMTLARVGAADHYEHRAVGDIVNTASRLEQLSKQFGSRLLVSAQLVDGLEDAVTRCLGSVSLSGCSGAIVVHELLGWGAVQRDAQAAALSGFEAARAAYDSGEYVQAREGFQELLGRCPEDPVVAWYLRQLEKREHVARTP